MLSRRAFLLGSSAAAIAAAMPAAATSVAPAAKPALKAFVVGTPGEYDWQHYWARSAEQAFSHWRSEHYDDDDDAPRFDPDYVQRIPQWDGRSPKSITPADWIDANLGHCCERCGYETHPETGARVVAGEVVCEECLTFADRALCDADDLVEDLASRVADAGEDEVRELLEKRGDWEAVKDFWPRVLEEASAA